MRVAWIALLTLGPLGAQNPTDFNGWLNRGLASYKQVKISDAITAFQEAIKLNPNDATAHQLLATAYMSESIPEAAAEFRRVLELDPNNATALESLALLSLQQHKLAEAREWNKKLAAVKPNDKQAYYSLGVIDWTEAYQARMTARKQLGMRPEAPGPIPATAVRLALKNQNGPIIEDGITNLEKTLQIDPESDEAMAYMNLVLRERADLRDTLSEYDQDIAAADQWVKKSLDTKRKYWQSRAQMNPPPPPPPPPPGGGLSGQARIRVSGNEQAFNLIHKTDPVYPPLALQARIQGTVRFTAIIDKQGHLANLQLVSGHPLLVQSAQDAVKQYIYRPTLLNGEPVEVVTQIDIGFQLPQ